MYNTIALYKSHFYILLFWLAAGVLTGPLVYAIVPLHLLYLNKRNSLLILLLGLWFILVLSDSRHAFLQFSVNLKAVMMVVLAWIAYTNLPYWGNKTFYKPFLPFLAIAAYSMFMGPDLFNSFQKTLSYGLLLFIVPNLVSGLMSSQRDFFLKGVAYLGTLVLLAGFVLRIVAPEYVIFRGERFSGILGNPNGLGIFSLMFAILFYFIGRFHPALFSRNQKIFIWVAIGASLVMAGSRGALFSTAIFFGGIWLFKRSIPLGFVVMIAGIWGYQVVVNNFEEIVISMGLEDYFRLETLESGSGRLVAYEFAWNHIHQNYWLGKGFGYAEHLMAANREYFENKGHDGNVHNSYLTIWLDTGLVGLIALAWGWLVHFFRASRFTPLAWAALFAVGFSAFVESWLAASLNPFTIQLVIILTLLADERFYEEEVFEPEASTPPGPPDKPGQAL